MITELMYHPRGADEPALEWVELYNDSAVAVDLSGYFFSDGIRFLFEEGSFLDGRSYVIVCADVDAFRERYGADVAVAGSFDGRLDNGGEAVALANQNGSTVARVRYRVGGRWPTAPDGGGYSLALRSLIADPALPESWTRSRRPGGTPGDDNFRPPRVSRVELFPARGDHVPWRFRPGWSSERGEMADFSSPPRAWTRVDFDDSDWLAGVTPIGYGERDVATELPEMRGNYIAFAARRTFSLTEAQLESADALELAVHVDDGCVAWINGREVARLGLSGEPGEPVPFDARAISAREADPPSVFVVRPELVRPGDNLLAIQVHNSVLSSNDALLAASLAYLVTEDVGALAPPVRVSEVFPGTAGAGGWIELENTGASPVDVGGLLLRRDTASGAPASELAPAVIAPGGTHVVDAAALAFALDGPELQLFLFLPDDETIVDAATLRFPDAALGDGRGFARLDGGRFLAGAETTPGERNPPPPASPIVINEIHYRPLLDPERREFLELHNSSDAEVSLAGFRLDAGYNVDFGADARIAPGGFLVVARDPAAIREVHDLAGAPLVGPAPDATADELERFGRLRDAGEEIRLIDPLGNVVDAVDYRDGGDWDRLADGGGSSLELIDPRQDNGVGHAWTASDESARAPWIEVTFEEEYRDDLPPAPMESELWLLMLRRGECLIDDVSVTAGDPPVEQIANGDFEEDTRPWRLLGNHIHSTRTTAEAATGSASLHLVATGAGDGTVNHVEIDTETPLRPGPVRVRFRARWLRGCDKLHVSFFNNAGGRTITLPTPPDPGTPGRENRARAHLREGTGSDNLGPVISRVSHSPAVPGPGEPVRVTATVTDADGVASASVLWRRDAGRPGPLERIALHDDGAHGDGAAGDGLFAADLPPGAQSDRIQFFVEAEDRGGRTRSYPLGGEDDPLVFLVDETFFPNELLSNSLSRYRLILDQRSLGTLVARLLHSDDLVPGTFIFDDRDVYYRIGARYRGSPWGRDNDPKMFRLRFRDDRPFRGARKRINLSRNGDNLEEFTAYYLIRKASVPSAKAPWSRFEHVNLKLNERSHAPRPMAEIQPLDKVHSDFWFPGDRHALSWKITAKIAFSDDGQMTGVAASQFQHYGASKEDVRYYFTPGMRKCEDEFGPLLTFLDTMDASVTPDAEFIERIEEIMAVESSLRVFVVRSVVSDWDTIGFGPGKNAYLHFSSLDGRVMLLPWDLDQVFGDARRVLMPGPARVGLGRLLSFPRWQRLYARLLAEGVRGPWSEAWLDPWLDRIDSVTGPARTKSPTSIDGYFRTRRAFIEDFLAGAADVPFRITTPDPAVDSTTTLAIEGDAPVVATTILASGADGEFAPLDVEWRAPPENPGALPTRWRATIDGLTPGRHVLELLALGAAGEILGSDSITLFNTSGWDPPAVSSIHPDRGRGAGGTEVSVLGSGFHEAIEVLFGDARSPSVERVAAGELRAVTPPGAGTVSVTVRNVDGRSAVLRDAYTYEPARFIRGDTTGDGALDITDAIAILETIFRGRTLDCADAADVNDDGRLTITDPIRLLSFLYLGGDQPAQPYPDAGEDATRDGLGCGRG